MLESEVYAPIGIHCAPINKTEERNPADDQPLFFQGYYPTLEDLAKLSQLFGVSGQWQGKQILNAELLADVLAFSPEPVGLPTYSETDPYCRKSFWLTESVTEECHFWVPMFHGWGKNYVLLLPGDVSVIRLARSLSESEDAASSESLLSTAHQVADLCG